MPSTNDINDVKNMLFSFQLVTHITKWKDDEIAENSF